MNTILAIDSGNTRIKWGLHSSERWLFSGVVMQGDSVSLEKSLLSLPIANLIIISNVAGAVASDLLSKIFSNWTIDQHWICALPYQCGVKNLYNIPNQLGSDRWASLIAAWNMLSKACVVVNVGTSTTVDMLSSTGVFLGGVIIPGSSLMYKSLRESTDLSFSQAGNFVDFPLCTSDAIETGIVSSLVGAIERIFCLYRSELNNSELICVISGGGFPVLQHHLNIPFKIELKLVLDGLIVIANDNISNHNEL